MRLLLLTVLLCTRAAQPTTVASTLDHEIGSLEKNFLALAQVMPEDRYNFTPATLNIRGSDFAGVRSFATQIRHAAASNYAIWSGVTGDKFPKDFLGGDGPENLKTKAEILQFLKDSFALGHKAALSLTGDNGAHLRLVVFGMTHAMDHYGQMVEYLRMNGITPPPGH